MKNPYKQLVKKEIDHYINECNFDKREKTLFVLRTKGETLDSCAYILNVSLSTAKRINNSVKNKIKKIA